MRLPRPEREKTETETPREGAVEAGTLETRHRTGLLMEGAIRILRGWTPQAFRKGQGGSLLETLTARLARLARLLAAASIKLRQHFSPWGERGVADVDPRRDCPTYGARLVASAISHYGKRSKPLPSWPLPSWPLPSGSSGFRSCTVTKAKCV
jgi:hypothetical protein